MSIPNLAKHFFFNVTKHDVFLSFRGPDVRKNFVDHLYHSLTISGIDAFLDSHKLNKGDDIASSLEQAIRGSRIRIPIFSTNFAQSAWCLKEVSLMSRLEHGLTIPLFYNVTPTQVRYPNKGPFGDAFEKHYNLGRYSRDEIDGWKNALIKVSNLSGWSLEDSYGYEAELVKRVVQDVAKYCK
eukprot:Gb_03482 [translate_table: standard]